jgi:hypothetical protein
MKLSTDEFIKKAFSLPTSFFIYSLESIVDEEIFDVRELLREEDLLRIEPELIDEIVLLISKIAKGENWFKKFFYNLFGIEVDVNSYRRRLKYLFDLLYSDANRLREDIENSKDSSRKVEKILNYLQELNIKLLKTDKNNKLNKKIIFIKEIEGKIRLLENYTIALSLREVNLLEMKKIYKIMELKGY